MTLGSTQPLTELNIRNLPGGKGRLARKADNLTAICERIVWKMWEPRRLTTLWASTACNRDSFTFYFLPFIYFLGTCLGLEVFLSEESWDSTLNLSSYSRNCKTACYIAVHPLTLVLYAEFEVTREWL
jgi:hypothetical protein